MKRVCLYILLFTYSTIIIRPLLPYIKDGLAHLLFYEEHMSTVHAHNGKFHTHLEVRETEKNEQHQQSANDILKKEISTSVHILTDMIGFSFNKKSVPGNYQFDHSTPADIYLPSVFPPPKS